MKVLSAKNVKLVFILKTVVAKLVSETVLNVAVLLFAKNAIQMYQNWIPTINASVWLDLNLTLHKIFVLINVLILTVMGVTAVIKLNAWHVMQVFI